MTTAMHRIGHYDGYPVAEIVEVKCTKVSKPSKGGEMARAEFTSRCLAAWLSGNAAVVRCPAIVNALSYILIHCRSMEYSGVEFAIRARPGRDEWTWTIYPKDARAISREFTGSRDEAVRAVRQKIDRWLTEHQALDVHAHCNRPPICL